MVASALCERAAAWGGGALRCAGHALVQQCIHHPSILLFVVAVILAVAGGCRRALRGSRSGEEEAYTSFSVQKEATQEASASGKCEPPFVLRETIFVALVVPPGEASAVRLRENIFSQASVASRVFVGIYDFGGGVHCPSELQNQVRIERNLHIKMLYSAAQARARLLGELYQEELYVLLVPHDAKLAPRWDVQLVRMHSALANPERAIITSHCGELRHESVLDATPRFLCLAGLRGARWVLEARCVAEPPSPEGVPSSFWSPHFSFCFGSVLRRVPLLQTASEGMESTVNSVRLWTGGFDFFVPSATLAWSRQRPFRKRAAPTALRRVSAGATPASPDVPSSQQRTLMQFEAFCGVQLRAPTFATPRSLAGLTRDLPVSECTCKYGSIENARLVVAFHHQSQES